MPINYIRHGTAFIVASKQTTKELQFDLQLFRFKAFPTRSLENGALSPKNDLMKLKQSLSINDLFSEFQKYSNLDSSDSSESRSRLLAISE